ncbi:MAG TPA: Clp protease N-terminal domain-containing protein [Candidatus Obscuribacterales bacterium]
MFEAVFDRAGDEFVAIAEAGLDECLRLKNRYICTEHLLLALLSDPHNIGSQAFATMTIKVASVKEEVERILNERSEYEAPYGELQQTDEPTLGLSFRKTDDEALLSTPAFSRPAVAALLRAGDYSRYLGYEEIEPEHLMLGIIDQTDSGAARVFEELSVNLTFLKRQVMQLMARQAALSPDVPNLREAAVMGLKELIEANEQSANCLAELADRCHQRSIRLPSKAEIVHMVMMGFLGEFLFSQVAFQRYILEETITALARRCGPLDKELTASIVSTGATNMRAQVRSTIEHLLSHECRLLTQMLNDAEHDLIGSVIEDLWWTQSEEIALHELFAEAMDDHRRKHLLNLQKRRIEISQRLNKLKTRLDDTIRQCFVKRSASA